MIDDHVFEAWSDASVRMYSLLFSYFLVKASIIAFAALIFSLVKACHNDGRFHELLESNPREMMK